MPPERSTDRDVGALVPLELQLDLVDDVHRLQDARAAALRATRELAVDLAWARALHGVSAPQLAALTGLTPRAVRKLTRMSAW